MYKYIALTALVLGSAALGFSINRGDGEQFTLAKVIPASASSPNVRSAILLDIDQDGLDDVVRAFKIDVGMIVLSVRYNLGDTTLSPWSTLGEYELPDIDGCTAEYIYFDSPSVLDLNGDSLLDIVYPLTVEDGGSWCLASGDLYFINNGAGGFTCAGDINDDGETDVTDLLGVIGDWGCIEEGQPD